MLFNLPKLLKWVPTPLLVLASFFLTASPSLHPESIRPALNCEDFSVTRVEVLEGAEGSNTGRLMFFITTGEQGLAYDVSYRRGDKPFDHQVTGLIESGGVLHWDGVLPGDYQDIRITRQLDGCVQALSQSYTLAANATLGSARTGCGLGSFSYTNCRNQTVTIDRANLTPNSWFFSSPYANGTISYVNSSCQITDCVPVYCIEANDEAPTPGYGYAYGEVTFTQVTGHTAAGISELNAERINWINCRGQELGYTDSQMQQAIWCVLGTSGSCNALSTAAINSVPSVEGGIGPRMTFYIPSQSNIQIFVPRQCVCPSQMTPASPLPPLTVCQGAPFGTMSVSIPGGGYNYQWEWSTDNSTWANAGNPGNTTSALTINNYDSGVYYRVRISRGNCAVTSNSALYTVSNAPTLTATTTHTTCGNANGAIDLSVNSGSGLYYEYYEGQWEVLPNFNALTPIQTGVVSDFNISGAANTEFYGYRFRGKINITTGGTYTFYTNSDDGSRLYINGNLVVNNDGLHAAVEQSGTVTLPAGRHDIMVTYFQKQGGQAFTVSYAGPGVSKQVIPGSVLFMPYTIAWSNGSTAEDLTNIAAGTYTATVANLHGCTSTLARTITNTGGPTANAGANRTICAGLSTTLTATTTGGTAPLTYNWSNGLGVGVTKTVSPSSTTTYTVTVTG